MYCVIIHTTNIYSPFQDMKRKRIICDSLLLIFQLRVRVSEEEGTCNTSLVHVSMDGGYIE